MTASREIDKKSQKEPMSKWGQNGGFNPQMGHKFQNFRKLLTDSSTKSYEVSMIQNSKYLEKFFVIFILKNYTKKSKK